VWCAGLMAPAGACVRVLNCAVDCGVPPGFCWLVQAGGFRGVPGCLGARCAAGTAVLPRVCAGKLWDVVGTPVGGRRRPAGSRLPGGWGCRARVRAWTRVPRAGGP
jgi:hypothetical protein